ncbi:hypothetical protein G6F68_011378 [Rhizopus microsporus]|nr:hypothetical protein G6F68_011378 [Rhizopus microsporus]
MADEDAKDDPDVCMKEASSKRAYTFYTDQDKVRFFKLMFEKVLSASAAAKQLGIHVRMAQRWAQMYKTDPDSIFIKHKKTGRSCILYDEHKPAMVAPDRYRLWNRDVAACLNYMHILRGLRRNGMVPDRFRRVAVAPTRRRRRVDDQEQPRTRIRLDSSPS